MRGESVSTSSTGLSNRFIPLTLKPPSQLFCLSGQRLKNLLSLVRGTGSNLRGGNLREEGVFHTDERHSQPLSPRAEQKLRCERPHHLRHRRSRTGALEGVTDLKSSRMLKVEHHRRPAAVITEGNQSRPRCGDLRGRGFTHRAQRQGPAVCVLRTFKGVRKLDIRGKIDIRLRVIKGEEFQNRDRLIDGSAMRRDDAQTAVKLLQTQRSRFSFQLGESLRSSRAERTTLPRTATTTLIPPAGRKGSQKTRSQQCTTGQNRVKGLIFHRFFCLSILSATSRFNVVSLGRVCTSALRGNGATGDR